MEITSSRTSGKNIFRICKEPNWEAEKAIWHADSQRYFIALITAIARKIGYKFNAAEMERAYFPKGHVNMQNDQLIIQHCLACWLAGDLSVKMDVTSFPGPDDEAAAKQEELRGAAVDWLKKTRRPMEYRTSPPNCVGPLLLNEASRPFLPKT